MSRSRRPQFLTRCVRWTGISTGGKKGGGVSRRCRKAFCASIGRFVGCLGLGRGVTAEGELGRVARRLRPVSRSGWCMLTCYTRAGMESNWVQQRAAHNTLPLWRKKIRMTQRVNVAALMEIVTTSSLLSGWAEILFPKCRERRAETSGHFVRCVEAFAIFVPCKQHKSLPSSKKACSGWR